MVRRVVEIERVDIGPGLPAIYCRRPGGRKGRWIWWQQAEVPEFARGGGRVEIASTPGPRGPVWRIVGPPPPEVRQWWEPKP